MFFLDRIYYILYKEKKYIIPKNIYPSYHSVNTPLESIKGYQSRNFSDYNL